MREITLSKIEKSLSEHKGFFHSEDEIKLHLANHFKKSEDYDNVFIEYYVGKKHFQEYPWKNEKISIDIVLQKGQNFLPIEIKYRTKSQIFPHYVFGSESKVELAEQSAKNEGCYSFWKDIKRIEILKSRFNLTESGIVLFITNDPTYRLNPRKNSMYEPFSIHQNRKIDEPIFLNWAQTKNIMKEERANKFPGFEIDNKYSIDWKEMNIENHYYILI